MEARLADYKVTLPNAEPVMVRAANKAQAIRFVTHNKVAIELLTTEDAIKLAKTGQELLDATGMEPEPEQPLLEPPGNGTGPAGPDATTPGAAGSGASDQSGTSGAEEAEEEPPQEEKPKAAKK